MPPKLGEHFQEAAEFQRRFAELNGRHLAVRRPDESGEVDREALFKRMMAAQMELYSGAKSAEVARLREDLAAAGVELSPEESGAMADMINLSNLQKSISKLAVLKATISPALEIAELAGDSESPLLSLDTPQGFTAEDLLENLRSRRFVLEIARQRFEVSADDLRDLLGALARSVVAATQDPREMDLQDRIWNPARKFNPARVTRLRISGLEWDVLNSGSDVTVLCAGIEEVLATFPEERPQRGPLRLPQHPTFPAPWRVVQVEEDGRLMEQNLGASPEDAWAAYVDSMQELRSMAWAKDGPSSEDLLARFDKRDAEGLIVLEAEINRGHQERFRIERDHKDLAVISRYSLATHATREGAKAREIWFERFAEIITPALPDARETLRFDMESRMPRSPFRTFVAALEMGCEAERPDCPECGGPCDRVVHLDLRRHPQSLALPGTSLLLFTCEGDNLSPEYWQFRWLKKGEAASVIPPFLEGAEEVHAGPAFRDLDYETAKVDQSLLKRESERWPAYEDSWEKKYFMFASPGMKVGGWPSWIQGDCTPKDAQGKEMEFVGQVYCYDLIAIGDSGELYIFYSPATGETTLYTQFY